MAIGKKNSGFYKQDAVMGKLSADARKPYKVNAVVAQALEQGKRRKAYLEERAKMTSLTPSIRSAGGTTAGHRFESGEAIAFTRGRSTAAIAMHS